MALELSAFLKNDIKNLLQKKQASGKMANKLLKDISKELDDLKSLIESLPKNKALPKDITTQLIHLKPTFANISKLDMLLDDLLKSLPQEEKTTKEMKSLIKKIQIRLKNIMTSKMILEMTNDVKESLHLLAKKHENTPKLKNLIKSLNDFSKAVSKESDTETLKPLFKELTQKLFDIKDMLSNELPKKDMALLQKNIDTISSLLGIKNEIPKEIKHFDTIIKETLLSHKAGSIKLLNKKTMIKNIGNITKNINEISKMLPNDEKILPLKKGLEHFIKDIKHIDLKQNIKNSGVFLESKLHDLSQGGNLPDKLKNEDIKAILLKIKNSDTLKNNQSLQSTVDKTLTQIHAVQTNAYISQTFLSYIPFSWDELKDGTLSMAKLQEKEAFNCKIELVLEHYGKVDILMLFHKDKLSLKMDIIDDALKKKLKKHGVELENELKDLGYETNIFFSNLSKKGYDTQEMDKTQMGVDIKT